MKLLSKSELATAKAKERAQVVQEGLHIASKVDTLRETLVSEEQSLIEFRTKTLAQIHEETTAEATERDLLRHEVATLKQERETALAPLTEELARITYERTALIQDRETTEQQLDTLRIRESEIEERERTANDTVRRAQSQLEQVQREREDTIAARTEMLLSLRNAQTAEAAASVRNATMQSELDNRAVGLANQADRQNRRDIEQDAREQELNAGFRRLADREATLLRNTQRYGRRK